MEEGRLSSEGLLCGECRGRKSECLEVEKRPCWGSLEPGPSRTSTSTGHRVYESRGEQKTAGNPEGPKFRGREGHWSVTHRPESCRDGPTRHLLDEVQFQDPAQLCHFPLPRPPTGTIVRTLRGWTSTGYVFQLSQSRQVKSSDRLWWTIVNWKRCPSRL